MNLKDKIIKNRVAILVVIGILLVATIIVGISYAYFGNIEIKNNNTVSGNVTTNSYIFTSDGNGSLSITLQNDNLDLANASNEYTSYVSNTGGNINISLDANGLNKVYCTYDLVYVPSSGYTKNSEAVSAGLKELTLSGSSNMGNLFKEIDISGTSSVTLVSGINISTDATVNEQWNFTIKYYNLDVIQDNVIGQTFSGKIKVANADCSFNELTYVSGGDYVLLNSAGASSVSDAKRLIEAKGTPVFSDTATTNEGMYAATDDLGTSYYFRGAVDNNWVKFGKDSSGNDIYWRIIRINGDGSIRMIYSGTSSTATVMTGTGYQINATTYAFNSSYNNPAYVGYMYTEGEQHGNSSSSTIKTAIDNWYKTTTLETDATTKSLVADQIFCNDRSATTSESGTPGEISGSMSTSTAYYYGAYIRLYINKLPQLICPTDSDKFTVNTSNGNGALTYPVGLITADEVAMAGGVFGTNNSFYYLYTTRYYWSGSPFYFLSNYTSAYEFDVNSLGTLVNTDVRDDGYGARPVVSLSSKAKLSGNGTYDDVYTVS